MSKDPILRQAMMAATGDTVRSPVLRISERDWQARVIDAAKLFGWRYAHFRPARTKHGWTTAMEGHKGFPDLVLVKGSRLIFAELKAADGRVTPEQAGWLGSIPSPVEAYIWRPDDWDEVYTTLARKAK